MSCNGCRVLRKGCSDSCILRPCLQWIESPEAQGHATVFVAKFFGRAGMMSFISAVSESQRPALFQSLLYEACGRTVNPVFGAVGLLWSGNWAMCQAAVETVLKGGCLKPMSSCVSPSASAKPVHANSSKRSGPPPMMTTNLTKRSRGMMEANSNIDPDSKRLRSLDQLEDTMTPMGQPEQNVCVMNKPVVYARQEERPAPPPPSGPPSPSGQLVAPVPRRVRPQMGCFGVAAMVMRDAQLQQAAQQEQQQQRGPRQACEEQERQSHDESVELDLTLNSHAKLGSPACGMRASSPSSFSMNSEGSVISSDSAEFSACGMRTASPPMQEGRQFLHLL